ncbi:hypothetical protein [uncultured Arthrobacter sp.]|uniref:hypothetical protein n=1 Tax=uncultured Arthrobacter sp. TaxID=114050 RepID=UPI002638635E|nr:hypothetical protein [uncultured Arthrobacter sp.]
MLRYPESTALLQIADLSPRYFVQLAAGDILIDFRRTFTVRPVRAAEIPCVVRAFKRGVFRSCFARGTLTTTPALGFPPVPAARGITV